MEQMFNSNEQYLKEYGVYLVVKETEEDITGLKDLSRPTKCQNCGVEITVVPVNDNEWCPFCGHSISLKIKDKPCPSLM
jgi:predicted Zn-ribbon and HTH transcriptional regulator